ncbi:hypothetical protein ANN_09099 [Periplaneta americana]|uniref:DUF4817 domain-containing protein n=1 Tax=Periplaneta americana TaxID=6978 RepID=A0ABQ8TKF3_PERAM|nr:hypothetical protein ANN_09099 [Periplaneta americana]
MSSDNTAIIQAAFQRCKTWKSPDRNTINNWIEKLRTTASVRDNKPGSRARTVRTPENIERVRTAVIRSPKRSARRQVVAPNISNRSLRRISHTDLHFTGRTNSNSARVVGP